MPLYTDQSYYYVGGSASSQLYAPYYTPGLYTTPSTSTAGGTYVPFSSTYNRTFSGSYILPLAPPRTLSSYTATHHYSLSSRYQPKLSTITETSPLISARHGGIIPLTRIQSPKVSSYTTPSTHTMKYVPPRPIPINTADIDVSSSRYQHHKHNYEIEKQHQVSQYSESKRGSVEKKTESIVELVEEEVKTTEYKSRRSTIKRNRPVVRLSTIRSRSKERNLEQKPAEETIEPKTKAFKDLPPIDLQEKNETYLSWRQKLAEELASTHTSSIKKTPGDLMRERYLIQDGSSVNNTSTITNKSATINMQNAVKSQPNYDNKVIEVDLKVENDIVRRLSIPQCPSFHDICEDISSDKIDDDLNAGALRRRASIIQEQEHEILINQLQNSASGTIQIIHLQRRDSQDSVTEECHRQSTKKRKSRKSKKIKHKITAIVEVENSPLLPMLLENDEFTTTPAGKESYPTPKFTFNVDSVDEHDEIQKVVKLSKRKSIKKVIKPKEGILPEGFMQGSPKMKSAVKPKTSKTETTFSAAEVFTFEPANVKMITERDETIERTEQTRSTEEVSQVDTQFKQSLIETDELYISKSSSPSNYTTQVSKGAVEKSKSFSTSQEDIIKNAVRPKTKSESPKSNIKSKLQHKEPKAIGFGAGTSVSEHPKQQESAAGAKNHKAIKAQIIETGKSLPPRLADLKQSTIEKCDSGEDFWAQIGNRESVYMTSRKKGLLENQWQKREELLESQAMENVSNILEIKSAVTAQKNEVMKKADQDIAKSNEKGLAVRSQSTESAMFNKDKKVEENLEHLPKVQQKTLVKKSQNSSIDGKPEYEIVTTSPNASTPTDMTKINSGQEAKSPEQLANIFKKQTDNDNDNKTNTEQPKLCIGQKSVANIKESTSTPKTPNTPSTPKTPKNVNVCTEKKTNTKATPSKVDETNLTTIKLNTKENKKTEIEAIKQTDANIRSDAADDGKNNKAKSPPVLSETPKTPNPPLDPIIGGVKAKNQPKTTTNAEVIIPTTTTKLLPNAALSTPVGKPTASPRNASVEPLNADQFILAAPPKSATSPTKTKMTSPQKTNANAKTKQSTPPSAIKKVNKDVIENKMNKTKSSPVPAPIITTIAATTTTVSTSIATKEIQNPTFTTIPTFPTASNVASAVVATESLIRHGIHEDINDGENNENEKAHVVNNLSKFATVQNLAQCLQDVDADLEDFIPSSAEISDDENSSCNYSSTDDYDYKTLSASMKKKIKQQRKKEKQAEKARFDPHKKIKIDPSNKCYVKEEAPRYPLVATPRPLWKREKIIYPDEDSDDESDDSNGSGSGSEETEDSEECTTSEEYDDDLNTNASGVASGSGSNVSKENSAIIRLSTCSNDSGFEGGTAPSSPKKMLETSYTYSQFHKSGRFTAPATVIPRFKNYSVDDFHFLAVLGKGSFGKVLLAELRDTTYYYAVKCLKKDVVLEDDDVDSTLIERKVLALGTKHPYLCHLFCTFQTESHLFFVMEYLNGGDLMFHIQESGRFPEERARFYGAEIISGLKFLHKKGIIYRDLKLDNVLLDYEGHVRIADFGMCKLQIYLDKTADSFCGTPDYMAPEIIKGEKYNQNVDWWSFGVLLYEMLIGQSPFSGCDEDELFWSICNEIPWFPVYISAEATGILRGLLEKDYTKRIGSQYSPAGDISDHIFFRPIDWDALEKRQLPPPYKPLVKHPLDTQYFDRVFTKERVRLTPIERDILQSMDQKPFLGFTYTNPHIALD